MAVAFSLWIMNSLCMCVNRVHMYGICVHVYEGIATYICMCRDQRRMLCSLPDHSPSYPFEIEPHTEPGARLVTCKLQ